MLTTAIRQRVRDNLNRDDTGIDTKIQDWINDAKLRIEQRHDMDYMRNTDLTLTVTNAAPAATLFTRLKDIIQVQYRKTLPAGELETSWTPIPALSEAEILRINGYDTAGALVTGAPLGYALGETTITVYPKPDSGDTFTLALTYWRFSADWTFGALEEPYLAKFAYPALIDGATALGHAFLGEHNDAEKWEKRFEGAFMEFLRHEIARALEGEISLRPRTGADDRRPSLSWGYNL
jgi:hypothetical protein